MDIEAQQANSESLVKAMKDMSEFKHSNMFIGMLDYLTTKLESGVREREAYFNTLTLLRDNYIVNGIYDILSNDLFVTSGIEEYFTVEVEGNDDLTEDIKETLNRVDIYTILLNVLPELLHYGSYPLKPVFKDGKGLVALLDEYDPAQVVPIYSADNIPLFYFVSRTPRMNNDYGYAFIDYSRRTTFDFEDMSSIFFLSSDVSMIKLELPEKIISQFRTKLPDDIRSNTLIIKQPRSFIWPARDKIKDALILEKVAVAKNIAKSLAPTVLGVPVPTTFDPNKLVELVKKYSDIINGSGGGSLATLENVEMAIKEMGQIKVIPVAGDKSYPTPIETGRGSDTINQSDIEDSLSRALTTLSISPEVFQGSGDSASNRRSNIRYAKRLKRLRKDISRSLSILCLMHIAKKFPDEDVKLSDIKITFKNNINNDELENVETQDLIISSIDSMVRLFDSLGDLTEGTDYEVDRNELLSAIRDSLSSIGSGYSNVLSLNEEEELVGTSDRKVEDPDIEESVATVGSYQVYKSYRYDKRAKLDLASVVLNGTIFDMEHGVLKMFQPVDDSLDSKLTELGFMPS